MYSNKQKSNKNMTNIYQNLKSFLKG